jgi:nucleotide-binding universal stress UspA family protein
MRTGRQALKVVVATDGSEGGKRAVGAAAQMPLPDGSEFKVVSVVERHTVYRVPETEAALRKRAQEVVAAGARRLRPAGRPVSTAVLAGPAAQAILDAASRWGASLIVVGSRGLRALERFALGSVSAGVVRAADCSVLVVKGRLAAPLRAVMAIDGSKAAQRAARQLAHLSGPGGVVTLVSVICPPQVRTLGLLPDSIAGTIQAELNHTKAEMARRALTEARKVAGMFQRAGWKTEVMIRSGDPYREIVAATREAGAPLVAAGPRGVTGLERIVLGSVAEQLLLQRGSTSVFIGR